MGPAYYNENDPKAAAWLRELISAGLIAPGDVDERSILDVKPHEIAQYRQQHFFAGIGGWSLALRLAGWPDNRPVRTGSCPCQPFSQAGKGLGEKDERHLWPVFRDLIAFGEPAITFGEQVASKAGRVWLDGVRADLEGLGAAFVAADLCAAGVGAPHIRQRLWWCAVWLGDRDGKRREKRKESNGDTIECRERASRRGDAGGRGGPGGMANSNGGDTTAEREQCGGEQRLFEKGDGPRGVADAGHEHAGRAPRSGEAEGGRALSDAPGCGDAGRVEHAEGGGWEQRRAQSGGRGAAGGCGAGRVGDANRKHDDGAGFGTGDDGRERQSAEGVCGFWDHFDLLPCLDGKARRVEPGSFPLVTGLPRSVVPSGNPGPSYAQATAEGRVARLRGYGNSIVPQVAAQFILALMEALDEALL